MQSLRRLAGPTVLCLTLWACGEGLFAPPGEYLAAEEAAQAWVARNPDGWAGAASTSDAPTRPEWTPACGAPESNGYVSLRIRSPHGDIELSFACPLDERATIEELQEHFVRAVPWNLPIGIQARNFEFQARLQSAAIFDGVTFHEPRAGYLAVNIVTTMLAVRGESTREGCRETAPGRALPDACLVQIVHRKPLAMRFTALGDLSALR